MIKKIKSFLFENTSDKQTIIKNTFWLILAEFFNKGGIFLVTILIARILGAEEFGILSFVMAFVSMFIVLTDFGLTTLMVREVSKDHSKIQEYFINLSFLKVILGIITFLLVWGVSQFIGKVQLYITLILVYAGYSILNNFLEFIRAFFRPSEKNQYEALLKIINGIIFLAIVGTAIFYYGDLISIVYAFLISGIINLIISLIYVVFNFEIGELKLSKETIKSSLKSGVFLMSGILCITVYVSSDQLIMGFYNQIEELGVYSLAYRIILIHGLLSGILFSVLLTKVSNLNYIENLEINYKNNIIRIFKYNFIVILLLELFILILYILGVSFGNYNDLYLILSILLLYCLVEPLGYWGYINLMAIKKENINLIFVFITAVINIILNIIFIPQYSYYGAIISTILSYLIYFLLTYFYLTGGRHLNIKETL